MDVACGAGRFARRMADLGGRVIAIDSSIEFIERARTRTPKESGIEYCVVDAANIAAMQSFGIRRFDKAVCTMALMDMPEIQPLLQALKQMLKPAGALKMPIDSIRHR